MYIFLNGDLVASGQAALVRLFGLKLKTQLLTYAFKHVL